MATPQKRKMKPRPRPKGQGKRLLASQAKVAEAARARWDEMTPTARRQFLRIEIDDKKRTALDVADELHLSVRTIYDWYRQATAGTHRIEKLKRRDLPPK